MALTVCLILFSKLDHGSGQVWVNNDRHAATPEAPAKAGGSGLLKPAQVWPLMSPLSGGSILPVSLRCLTSIFTPPRLFNRVSVIELINLTKLCLASRTPLIGSRHPAASSDWLRMTRAVSLCFCGRCRFCNPSV